MLQDKGGGPRKRKLSFQQHGHVKISRQRRCRVTRRHFPANGKFKGAHLWARYSMSFPGPRLGLCNMLEQAIYIRHKHIRELDRSFFSNRNFANIGTAVFGRYSCLLPAVLKSIYSRGKNQALDRFFVLASFFSNINIQHYLYTLSTFFAIVLHLPLDGGLEINMLKTRNSIAFSLSHRDLANITNITVVGSTGARVLQTSNTARGRYRRFLLCHAPFRLPGRSASSLGNRSGTLQRP